MNREEMIRNYCVMTDLRSPRGVSLFYLAVYHFEMDFVLEVYFFEFEYSLRGDFESEVI